ncbi:MAG: hypothetical protein K6D96_03905 [Acetatifactor sp.]|nr:hypothetical protein [Acetatifactor sp.]
MSNKLAKERVVKELPKYMWSVATGKINIFWKKSRQAVDLMTKQDGFIAIFPTSDHTLFFYDSENNAKGARNIAKSKGILCGKNICRFRNDETGPIFDDPNFESEAKKK